MADEHVNERAVEDHADGREGGQPDDQNDDAELPEPLLDVLADPRDGRNRLPYLLGLLEGDDPRERLAAGTAVCLVVETHPELCDYAVERLVDRLGEESPVEVAHALDYLAARHTREVDEAVADLEEAAERRARQLTYQTGGGFARNEYLARTESERPVGRTRIAGSDSKDDPRLAYTNDEHDDRDRPDESGRGGEDTREEDTEETDGPAGARAEPPPGDADVVGEDDTGRGVTSGTLQLVSRRLSSVIERSRFDDLTVLTDRRRGRYGDVYRTAGTLDGEAHAVRLAVYRLPESDQQAFVGGFRDAMSDWAQVDDHESVHSVYDWGVPPRPWTALEYVPLALVDRQAVEDPLWNGVCLADALAHIHQHGVVHGAVDPGNVAYRDDVLVEMDNQRPLLTNVGLATATGSARPGVGVDPRYAAPEHYDDRFGRIDHTTDVYGLGVVLYRLCTGEHPYYGDPGNIREEVVGDGSLEPGAIEPDVPRKLDQVVRKATATRKLQRYETVNTLRGELHAIRDG